RDGGSPSAQLDTEWPGRVLPFGEKFQNTSNPYPSTDFGGCPPPHRAKPQGKDGFPCGSFMPSKGVVNKGDLRLGGEQPKGRQPQHHQQVPAPTGGPAAENPLLTGRN